MKKKLKKKLMKQKKKKIDNSESYLNAALKLMEEFKSGKGKKI